MLQQGADNERCPTPAIGNAYGMSSVNSLRASIASMTPESATPDPQRTHLTMAEASPSAEPPSPTSKAEGTNPDCPAPQPGRGRSGRTPLHGLPAPIPQLSAALVHPPGRSPRHEVVHPRRRGELIVLLMRGLPAAPHKAWDVPPHPKTLGPWLPPHADLRASGTPINTRPGNQSPGFRTRRTPACPSRAPGRLPPGRTGHPITSPVHPHSGS